MLSNAAEHVHLFGRSLAESGWDLTQPDGEHYKIDVPPFYLGLLVVSGLVFFLCLTLFEYAYFNVFMTLCMVENPTTTIILHEDASAPLSAEDPTKPADEEVIAVQNPPITSSIRRLRKHLRATCGRFASFRGVWLAFSIFLTTSILSQIVMIPFSRLGPLIAVPVTGFLVSLLLARWTMTWTHVVVSEPSPLPWWRRVPPLKTWKKILPATATYALARQINLGILVLGVGAVISTQPKPEDNSDKAVMHALLTVVSKFSVVLALMFLSVIFLVVPSAVALVRTHVSLLPETTETIVPVDRSFGGKVVPEVLGGDGCLRLRDAFSTVNRATISRIVKMFLKGAALEFALIMIALVGFLIEGAIIGKHMDIHKEIADPQF